MSKFQKYGALTIIALFSYVALMVIAMFLFVGGIESAPELTHYSFFQNSLSDLGMLTSYDGGTNYYSAVVFTLGTTIFGLAFIPFSIAFPRLFKEKRVARILSIIAGIIGYIVALGMVVVAFTPHNYGGIITSLHLLGVFAAYISMFLSTMLYGISIFLQKDIKNIYGIISFLYCIVFLTTLIMGLLGLGGTASNIIQQIGQKVGRSITVLTYLILSTLLKKKV